MFESLQLSLNSEKVELLCEPLSLNLEKVELLCEPLSLNLEKVELLCEPVPCRLMCTRTTDLQQNSLHCVACAYIRDNTKSKAYDIVN